MPITIKEIHKSLVNGQRVQMVRRIQEYGNYDFWSDYEDWMKRHCFPLLDRHHYFTDATVSYFKITNR